MEGGDRGAERASVIASYGIMDTPAEREFDDIAHLASRLCGTSVAFVSLIDDERQWFKAAVGADVAQTDLDNCVCLETLGHEGVHVINDLAAQPATSGMWFVKDEPRLRFYAGSKLVDGSGVPYGSVCVLDCVPRPEGLRADQVRSLDALARQAASLLEMRRLLAEQAGNRALEARFFGRVDALLAMGDAIHGCSEEDDVAACAAKAVGTTLGCRRVGYARTDPDSSVVVVDVEWLAAGTASLKGFYRIDDGWAPLVAAARLGSPIRVDDLATDPRTRDKAAFWSGIGLVSATFCPVFVDGAMNGFFFLHRPDGETPWYREELSFLKEVASRTGDALERVGATRRERLNAGELGHRLKNAFAMVLAIANQTLRTSCTKEEASAALHDRLVALSRSQDLLTEGGVDAAPLSAVVREALRPFAGSAVSVAGPDIVVGPRTATSFAMVLHELATNAAKYGALASCDGHVEVAWSLTGVEPHASLDFRWTESGGPRVQGPSRAGFGSRVIRSGFASSVKVEQVFEPSGVTCTIRAGCGALGA